jgi:elongation factor G
LPASCASWARIRRSSPPPAEGEVVALARMEASRRAPSSPPAGTRPSCRASRVPKPVFGLAIAAEKRNDDVKLSGVIAKLVEEDPTLSIEHNHDTNEMVLWGQGDIHLQIALDRMRTKYNLAVVGHRPQSLQGDDPAPGQQHSRFKRQSGGHGQFADITIEVKPLPRGGGLAFTDTVVGGAVPKNYIPAVEDGVMEYLKHGPLGFPGRRSSPPTSRPASSTRSTAPTRPSRRWRAWR